MEKDKVLQSWPVADEMQVGIPKEGRRPQLRSARSRRAQQMRPLRRRADDDPVEDLNNKSIHPP